ncbi:MAG: GMC family oxidoreductase N-terminal domain-containing protein [Pseudomonadota bacterium]|nr:GMC family oxidoreductase N-terminal domain-containing protein [Pseudomonadota bacterium]
MNDDTVDYIVIGAGSAGSVLANRLSTSGKHQVLLLEAGRAGHPLARFPFSYAKFLDNPAVNWLYKSEPEEGTANRRLPVPRGKMLGGSSSINGLVFVRGQAQDFDTWAQLGNRGWSYEDVLPIFKDMENYSSGGNNEFRGNNGPLKISDTLEKGMLYEKIIEAANHHGIEFTGDYNGKTQDGVCMSQTTISNGRRMSTAHCYLDPARTRQNLKIKANAFVETLILEGKKCIGVQYKERGQTRILRTRREVIVSGGTINSPKILELSGIGRPDLLKEHGINVAHELKGVGENLRDHFSPRFRWSVPKQLGLTYNEKGRGIRLVGQALRYVFTKKGLLGMSSGPIRAFVRTREGLYAPNAMIVWFPFLVGENTTTLDKNSGISAAAHILRSESTGSVHIASPDPKQPPSINFNVLSAQLDREVTLEVARLARNIMQAPPLQNIVQEELSPGTDISSDQDVLNWIKETGGTTYHPVGTCKMGNDPMAVVDSELRVHGMNGLRVADASIMPTLTSGNTNAPSIMIGEKASKMILSTVAEN